MKGIGKNLMLMLAVLFVNCTCYCQQSLNNETKVVIIRHAEKPVKGDNLSCKGLNRALQLPDLLYSKYKIPDHIFVPGINNGKSTNQSRMYQTIIPFAVKYNADIDTRYNGEDVKALADEIMKSGGYVLVVWEHTHIPDIANALGIKDKNLKWKDEDYDSIWVITFKNGNAMLTVDKENLNPADACR